jgi:hypothetical protein
MNIVTKSTLLLTATLATGLISIQSHANVFGGSGQYVMMPFTESGSAIWVMDTETGKIRTCTYQGTNHSPVCGPWSKQYLATS